MCRLQQAARYVGAAVFLHATIYACLHYVVVFGRCKDIVAEGIFGNHARFQKYVFCRHRGCSSGTILLVQMVCDLPYFNINTFTRCHLVKEEDGESESVKKKE